MISSTRAFECFSGCLNFGGVTVFLYSVIWSFLNFRIYQRPYMSCIDGPTFPLTTRVFIFSSISESNSSDQPGLSTDFFFEFSRDYNLLIKRIVRRILLSRLHHSNCRDRRNRRARENLKCILQCFKNCLLGCYRLSKKISGQ